MSLHFDVKMGVLRVFFECKDNRKISDFSVLAWSDPNGTKIENLEGMVLEIRGQRVLLDRDLAFIYGVETRDIN
jgi:hypothetical protein